MRTTHWILSGSVGESHPNPSRRNEGKWIMKSRSHNTHSMIEALEGRSLMSAAASGAVEPPLAPPTAGIVVASLTQKQTLNVNGTFSVTNVHGSRLSAT